MAKNKGLGRGLDALFGEKVLDLKAKPMAQMEELEISRIYANPSQPRTVFDEDALEELAASIRELGLIQPITVKPDGERYMIISGERRWRASSRAGLERIPAYIREVDDQDLHAMALVENIQREDLNAIEVALGLQRLIEECGLTQEALSDKVGKKRSTISNYMRLLKLPSEVQLALKEGVISMGHAKALASLEERKKMVSALKRCIKHSLSVRQMEELCSQLQHAKAKPQASLEEEYPESYTRLVEEMERYFSQNISIKKNRQGKGRIVIDFESDADIESFLEKLSRR